jgi:pimeloyl-ACP methyl ester carboxylesterase
MAGIETHHTGLAGIRAPTRFLLGEKSPAFLRDATARLHAMVPGSDVVELPGQAHIAMDVAPDLFEREVRAFFLGA